MGFSATQQERENKLDEISSFLRKPRMRARVFSLPLLCSSFHPLIAAASSQGNEGGGRGVVVKVIYVHGSKLGGEIQLDAIIHG